MKENLACGNDPAELFDSLQTGASVFILSCKECHKTLISIDNKLTEQDGVNELIALFKCSCGKKYKKTVMTLADGYLCKQGRVHILPERMRVGIQGWSNPTKCYVSFTDSNDESVHYVVTKDSIHLKKGLPTDA